MNFFEDISGELNFKEVKENALEAEVNDVIDEWHMHYQGELSLSEYLANQMDWTQMQAKAWLSGKGFYA